MAIMFYEYTVVMFYLSCGSQHCTVDMYMYFDVSSRYVCVLLYILTCETTIDINKTSSTSLQIIVIIIKFVSYG